MATPTRDQLRNEIISGPLAAELAPLFTKAHNADMADILNRKDLPGWVPGRHVVATLAAVGKWGLVELAVRHRLLPDESVCPVSLYSLLAAVHLAAYGTINPPIRMEVGPLTNGANALVATGLLSQSERDLILAGEVKISRAEFLWGLDAYVTPEQIGAAR